MVYPCLSLNLWMLWCHKLAMSTLGISPHLIIGYCLRHSCHRKNIYKWNKQTLNSSTVWFSFSNLFSCCFPKQQPLGDYSRPLIPQRTGNPGLAIFKNGLSESSFIVLVRNLFSWETYEGQHKHCLCGARHYIIQKSVMNNLSNQQAILVLLNEGNSV